jgi:hypothetical protein
MPRLGLGWNRSGAQDVVSLFIRTISVERDGSSFRRLSSPKVAVAHSPTSDAEA